MTAAAAATGTGVGVDDGEAAAHLVLHEVNRGAIEPLGLFVVHVELQAGLLDHRVVLGHHVIEASFKAVAKVLQLLTSVKPEILNGPEFCEQVCLTAL